MKKASFVILAILLLASCQNEKKTSLSFGQVVLTDEGMVLPVRKNPDSEKPFWCMDLAFENQYAVLRSPKELSTCYITFAYDADGHQDMATVNLDFHSIQILQKGIPSSNLGLSANKNGIAAQLRCHSSSRSP